MELIIFTVVFSAVAIGALCFCKEYIIGIVLACIVGGIMGIFEVNILVNVSVCGLIYTLGTGAAFLKKFYCF